MPHTRYVDSNGILITKLSGVVTLKELIEIQNELPSYVRNKELYELVLHSDDVEVVLGADESSFSADNIKRILKGIRKTAIAFVSNKDFTFGLLRQLEMRVENEAIRVSVFRSEETAHKWLNEMKSLRNTDTGNG